MMIGMKNMEERYKLKTGPGMRDVMPFKLFNKEEVIDEIKKLGFYSDFNDFKKEINGYKGEELLVLADPDEMYGQNWYICLTEAAKERELSAITDKVAREKAAEEARLKAIADAEAAKKAEEERIKNAVYEDKPFLSNAYRSETMLATQEEIFSEGVNCSRPLIKVSIKRKRREFGAPVKFGELGPQGQMMEFNKHKDPNFELERTIVDSAVQDCPSWTATWLPIDREKRVSRGVATDPMTEEEAKVAAPLMELLAKNPLPTYEGVPVNRSVASQTTFFAARNSSTQSEVQDADKAQIQRVIASGQLSDFLKECGAAMETNLQTNETVDIFNDPFAVLADDEVSFGNKDEEVMTELRTFTDLQYSKELCLSCIDWHPQDKKMVAVSCTQNITFDQRVQQSGKSTNAYVLIWSFADMIKPYLILQSPYEVKQFQFNAANPNLIAGGCITGQVVVWDVTEAKEQLRKASRKRASKDGGDEDEDQGKTVPPVRPKFISSIEDSHKRPVGDLAWLPLGMEVSPRGHIDEVEGKDIHQFVTVAGDGNFYVWDLRYQDMAKKKQNARPDKKGKGDDEIPWGPHFKITLTKMGGVGELLLGKLCMLGKDAESRFMCATEEGELVDADWREGRHAVGAVAGEGEKSDEASDGSKNINMLCQDHFRPCVALKRSPFFPDIFLSVGDWSFNIWKQGVASPIFSSPFTTSYFTCGLWSPTRPSVLLLGKVDGSVDIWDFLDQSHMPSMTAPVASSKITSMKFRDGTILACGDEKGNLHIIEVPRTLRKKSSTEVSGMTNFWECEDRRVKYVAARLVERGEGDEADDEPEEEVEELDEEAKKAARKAERKRVAEELKKEEDEYRKLEAYYREELGLEEAGENGVNASGIDVEVKAGDGF